MLATSKPLSPVKKAKIDYVATKIIEEFETYGVQAAFERMQQEKFGDIELIYLTTQLPSNVRNPITQYSRDFHNGKVPT